MSDVPNPDPNPNPNPGLPPAKPWFEGKADAETIGHWDNKGWKKDDPIAVAIEATKAARNLEQHYGVPADRLLKLPKDTSDEAGWRGVYERLGAPKEAKEYDFSGVKRAGADLDAGFADKMRAALFSAGVSKDRAAGIVKATVEHLDGLDATNATERAATLQADRASLTKDWGTNFEFNRLTAMQGAKRMGVSEEQVAKMEQAVGYKATMEHFFKIGRGTTEDTFTDASVGGNPTTRPGASARLVELQNDKAWGAKLLAGDAATKREFDNLMLMIYGEAA